MNTKLIAAAAALGLMFAGASYAANANTVGAPGGSAPGSTGT